MTKQQLIQEIQSKIDAKQTEYEIKKAELAQLDFDIAGLTAQLRAVENQPEEVIAQKNGEKVISDAHERYLDKIRVSVEKAYESALNSTDSFTNTNWDDYASEIRLPKVLSKTKVLDYVLSAFDANPFKTKKALKDAIQQAAESGELEYTGKKKFQVNYHGHGHSLAYAATSGSRPVVYDNFSRESIDTWISNILVNAGK